MKNQREYIINNTVTNLINGKSVMQKFQDYIVEDREYSSRTSRG